MILSSTVSPFPSKTRIRNVRHLTPGPTTLLPNTMLPGFDAPNLKRLLLLGNRSYTTRFISTTSVRASLTEAPLLWAARLCVYYALLKSGFAGSPHNPFLATSDLKRNGSVGVESDDLGFSEWLGNMLRKPDREASDRRKLVSKWHPTVKGTLRRNYRVNSKSEGRRLLKAIASLLSDDDHFLDASCHKGCQIRRESAHGESVCCNNVRALFDELPTPHIIVEITAFPAGPLGDKDYIKAEKLERVLRSSPNI